MLRSCAGTMFFIDVQLEYNWNITIMLATSVLITLVSKTSIRRWRYSKLSLFTSAREPESE